jgi:hypothetical protein
MTVDYTSIAANSALMATILTPVLSYINSDIQTYFLDLLAVPFVIFLITALTGAVWPSDLTVALFVIGVAAEIVLYVMMAIEQYYYRKFSVV